MKFLKFVVGFKNERVKSFAVFINPENEIFTREPDNVSPSVSSPQNEQISNPVTCIQSSIYFSMAVAENIIAIIHNAKSHVRVMEI